MNDKYSINFIVPQLSKENFSGGIYCILKYADGLAKRGHTVNVVPFYRSDRPQWIACSANFLIRKQIQTPRGSIRRRLTAYLDKKSYSFKNDDVKKALNMQYISDIMPTADLTIATAWNTAEPVYRFAKNKKAYFMQHFETIAFPEKDSFDKMLCAWSYQLPLIKIANSSWLQQEMQSYHNRHGLQDDNIYKCINAVDLDIYKMTKDPLLRTKNNYVKVISYGGRKVPWKGFSEMAQAIAIARRKLSSVTIEWLVYGEAELPPQNEIASYTPLGFLQPIDLANAYNNADIMLSASWCESFPLFPIEAMACGVATITTRKGTEDYAVHGENAEIVMEQNPDSIAAGLIKLINDPEYRNRIAIEGHKNAQKFNWKSSVDNMEQIIRNIMLS